MDISPLEKRVYTLLQETSSNNPLDIKNTNEELIEVKLKNPQEEVNIPNRIPYSERDIKEFTEECKEFLEKGIIKERQNCHAAPAFYVENHNEIKRGKRRIVINYKALNKATIGDAHKLPRIDSILGRIKNST